MHQCLNKSGFHRGKNGAIFYMKVIYNILSFKVKRNYCPLDYYKELDKKLQARPLTTSFAVAFMYILLIYIQTYASMLK